MGGTKVWNFSGGGGGGKISDSNSLGENTLEETAFWTFLSDKKCIQCNL